MWLVSSAYFNETNKQAKFLFCFNTYFVYLPAIASTGLPKDIALDQALPYIGRNFLLVVSILFSFTEVVIVAIRNPNIQYWQLNLNYIVVHEGLLHFS